MYVDLAKVGKIMNMDPPTSVKQLKSTLGHKEYYMRFIHNYALIIAQMDKLLNKYEQFMHMEECDVALNILKEKLVSVLLLVYPNWNK